MKREYNIYDKITDLNNLFYSFKRASSNKKKTKEMLEFQFNLENNLLTLQTELQDLTYNVGDYKSFKINDPKPRIITKATFRDRVVHHALFNVIEPIFEKTFISDTYANRTGKGTHRAMRRAYEHVHNYKYVLKCDIKKYFESINHSILKELIRKKIGDKKVLWLCDLIIDSFNPGLPLGNLTSQFFANIYLNWFDHYIKEELHCKAYLRYVDDFILFSDDKVKLSFWRNNIKKYLLSNLYLELHLTKQEIFPIRCGLDFVGYRLLEDRIRIRQSNVIRFRRKYKKLKTQFKEGKISFCELTQSVRSWISHVNHGNSWILRILVLLTI